jgi:tRNA pseudouridine13 synthase
MGRERKPSHSHHRAANILDNQLKLTEPINGYQSYIFNLTLSMALREGLDISRAEVGDNWSTVGPDGLTLQKVHGSKEISSEGAVPLVQLPGYAYRDYGSRFDSIISEIMKEEGIIPKQFYLKEAEEMSSEGSFRHAMIIGKAMSYELGERGTTLDFTLSRGEYATSLLREIIKPQTPLESGF